MQRDAFSLPLLPHELIIDNFAGGGGTSEGLEAAFGRHVDVAINHDPKALAMHRANHPHTRHLCESVWDVNPRDIAGPVGLVWLSPDCKHFSKAKGGKPVEKKIRGLAWVALRWAAVKRPRVIMLENVEEFVTWGPLVEQPDGTMKPCPKRKGREFNAFTNALKRQGYSVDWRELRACDYGAPTIRKRFFLIARRDGLPIVWPAPTHGDPKSPEVKAGKRLPWRTAAECIDWALPCPSIFLTKEEGRAIGVKRPLAEATMRRIARGVKRYVLESSQPFIVTAAHGEVSPSGVKRWGKGHRGIDQPLPTVTASGGYGVVAPILTEHANASTPRCMPADEPLRTICAQTKGGHHALIAPTLVQTGYGERPGQEPRAPGLDKPLGTIVAGGVKHALVAAFLAKHYGDRGQRPGSEMGEPISTITASDHHSLVAASMVKMRGTSSAAPATDPMHTISAGGLHHAEVRAFLVKYYGNEQEGHDIDAPLHTIPTRDRFGLVQVAGEQYQIADIGMRMLTPRELFRAQGFGDDYIIEHGIDEHGQQIRLTKTEQVRMVGNSVSPVLSRALVEANFQHERAYSAQA